MGTSNKTLVSALAPYILPADLLNWRDWRQLADWLAINDARGSEAAFINSVVAQEHCNAAGGRLEAAVLKGDRYTVPDIQWIQQNKPNQCWSMLSKMLCWIAIDSMSRFKRRTPADEQEIKAALDLLQEISEGSRILSFQESADAGTLDNTTFGNPVTSPSYEARRMFGSSCRGGPWRGWQ